MKSDCTTCYYFVSYRDEYFDDMEPWEYGRCHCSKSEFYDMNDLLDKDPVGEDNFCDYHETKPENEPL